MDIERLKFTKDWRNSSDFPTFEASEAKVREDMQLLHDEAKTHINEVLIPAVENGFSDADKTYATKDELKGVVLGQIPDGTITSEKLADDAVTAGKIADGSVTLEKVADGVIPDTFTKKETLKAATAELFGKDGTAVPDDIFFQIRLELLGKSLFTVKVLTQNGNPLPDIEISNVSSESGDPVKTDPLGIATGFVSPGSVNLGVLDYADIQNFQKGYVFEKGKKYSDEWTVTTRNFVKYTSSGRTRLSSNVTKADVSVGGAGGGGYTYEVGDSSGSKYGCGGGGGGYCKTQNSVSFTPDKYEDVVVGAGGENGGDGGASSFLGVSANGGKGGSRLAGGEGNGAGGTGGKYTTSSGTTNPTAGGAGSGTVFSSYTSTVSYGGGGGGSGSYNESGSGPSTMAGAAGGSPAGGKGGSVTSGSVGSASNGTANRGGGGGGSAIITNSTKVTHVGTPGKGGDGVVAVRMTISVE